MKLWEVIKELTEDPTKKFEREDRYKHWVIGTDVVGCAISGGTYYFMLDCDDIIGDAGKFNGNLASNEDDWQLVRQPVTWQEAIQAWADGKTIRLKMPEWEQVWKPTNAITFDHCQVTRGSWYVED